MKYFTFLLLPLIFSCTKTKDKPTDKVTGFEIIVKQNTQLQSGQFVANDVAATVFVWKADGKDFDLTNTSDMLKGYAFDKNSKVSLKYDYTGNAPIANKVPIGRYFVFVVITASGYGQYAHSYTYFNVTDNSGDINVLTKTFTTHATTLSYEDWNRTE